jgi:NitT/TauT family transport system ATP-binding protein
MLIPAISFDRVALRIAGSTIYEDLSFQVEAGEFLCLLGPSGCGKSTALRLMGDLMPHSGGDIRIKGAPPARAWDQIAYVFQSPRLLPWKSALENAAFGLELRIPAMPAAEREQRALLQMQRVGLGQDGYKLPVALSGGEKQRVAIARALALDPDIILMDEPFSALDPNTRTRLRRQVVELWQGSGKTVVFVTHDIDEALMLADRIIVLRPKPARVERTLMITASRPRDVESDASLREMRAELAALFKEMGESEHEEITA